MTIDSVTSLHALYTAELTGTCMVHVSAVMLIDTDCKELPGTGNRLNEHCMGPIAIVTLDYTGFGYKTYTLNILTLWCRTKV